MTEEEIKELKKKARTLKRKMRTPGQRRVAKWRKTYDKVRR